MNIVIVSTAFPLRGGIAHYVALLYRHLSKRHTVSVVTFSRQYPRLLFPGKTQEETGADESIRIPAEQLIDSINPFTWFSAARRIAELKPDLLIFKYWLPFFGPCFGTIIRRVKNLTEGRAKALFICDNIVPHEKRPFDSMFTNYAFRAVDACVVQSGAVERNLRSLFPEKPYRLVPHPIYNIFGEPVPKAGARKALHIRQNNVMVFFGYVRKYKGLDVLLRAMPKVLRSVKVKLLVVGEFYGDEQVYRKMIVDLDIAQWVEVRSEYVPNDQVAPYFCASDVVVLPYRSATQSGIVQIAYNFNRPVIATDVGGLSEVVIDGISGRIVPPADESALADAIIQFYEKNEEGSFVRGVHAEKKKYSWTHLVTAIEDLSRRPKQSSGGYEGRSGRSRRGPRSRGWDHSKRRRRSAGPHGTQERGQ